MAALVHVLTSLYADHLYEQCPGYKAQHLPATWRGKRSTDAIDLDADTWGVCRWCLRLYNHEHRQDSD